MTKSGGGSDELLYGRVAQILEQARGHVARTVNTAMVQTYWLIGREIVEIEQGGEQRAGYGDELIKQLSTRLVAPFGKASAPPASSACASFIEHFRMVPQLAQHC